LVGLVFDIPGLLLTRVVVVAGIWTAGISSSPEAPTSALLLARRGREERTEEELREEKRDTESGRQTQSFEARVEGVEIAWSLCVFQKKKSCCKGNTYGNRMVQKMSSGKVLLLR
jgi:hypothetical protein